jgi:hypothetical protein
VASPSGRGVEWFGDPRGALCRPGRRSEGSGKEERRPAVDFQCQLFLKPKRRGRGDAQAPLDEGNGGGTCGASLPLPPSMGGHPMAAPAGAVAARALSEEGDDPGWSGLGQIGRAERVSCENFHGNDLGYQGESSQIDNGLWQILFKNFKQRFGF